MLGLIVKRAFILMVLATALHGAADSAHANVGIKNGNFYMAYTDAVYEGGFGMKIDRVYNSKASFRGMFGQGWGAEFEVHLTIDADGSITVHEYGGGADNRFIAESPDPALIARSIQAIKKAALSSRKVQSAEADAYQKRLESELEFRNEEWEDLADKGFVLRMDLPVGTVLRSARYGYQYIKRTRDGYVRVYNSGKTESFDSAGRLTRVADRNDNFIDFAYDARGRLAAATDDRGRSFRFSINKRGLIEKIVDDRGREALYRYNDKDQLIQSTDVDKNQYGYTYDSRHNMTAILYSDGTSLEISYHPLEQNEHIRSLKERNGTVTTYDYFRDPKDPRHFGVRMGFSMPDGPVIARKSYEYFERVAADGTVWTSRTIEESGGDRIETEYNESGNPLTVVRDGQKGSFQYDRKGRVTRRETDKEIQEVRYHEVLGKIEHVKTISKAKQNQVHEVWYSYDDSGNLVLAKNTDQLTIKISYDDKGRVSDLVSGKDHLRFTYNAISKPEVINLVGIGAITTTYDEDGNISKVDRGKDPKVAGIVADTVRKLMEVIQPAGVKLQL